MAVELVTCNADLTAATGLNSLHHGCIWRQCVKGLGSRPDYFRA